MEKNCNKKNKLKELVDYDGVFISGDKPQQNNDEIETGPTEKPFNSDSDFVKGIPTTTDRVVSRYRQDIPWFAVYSYGGTSRASIKEDKPIKIRKGEISEWYDEFVKRKEIQDIIDRNKNIDFDKINAMLENAKLTPEELVLLLNKMKELIQRAKEKTINVINNG